jgi:hypothetical protein
MMRAQDAEVLEHRIGLRVLLRKRIGADPVMLQELLRFHALASKPRKGRHPTHRTVLDSLRFGLAVGP